MAHLENEGEHSTTHPELMTRLTDHLSGELSDAIEHPTPSPCKVGCKYNAAMKYLRKPAPILREGERTSVDVYIEKQRAFGEAQSDFEGILMKNSGQCCAVL